MSIDAAAPATPSDTAPIAMRVVTTYAGETHRYDIAVGGAESFVVAEGAVRTFPTAQLWPVIRDLLPPLDLLRARPAGRPAPPAQRPGPTFAEDCVAHVTIATLLDPENPENPEDPTTAADVPPPIVRTWLADADTLWSAESRPDGSSDVRPAADGAIADLVVWDVTGALELLARRTSSTGSTDGTGTPDGTGSAS